MGVWFLGCVPNPAAGAAQSPLEPLDSALTQREEFCTLSHQRTLFQLCLLPLVIHSSPNLCSRWELTGLSPKLGWVAQKKSSAEQHVQMTIGEPCLGTLLWDLWDGHHGHLKESSLCSLGPPQTWPGCFGQIAEPRFVPCKGRIEQPEERYCLPPTSSGNVCASQKI